MFSAIFPMLTLMFMCIQFSLYSTGNSSRMLSLDISLIKVLGFAEFFFDKVSVRSKYSQISEDVFLLG